jgi:hypothetical protein
MSAFVSRAKVAVAHLMQEGASRFMAPQATYGSSRIASLVGIEGEQVFVGYYDVQPFGGDGKTLLVHAVRSQEDAARIYRVDVESGDIQQLAATECWSWQLGARLQYWDDASFIFNALDGASPCASIVDMSGRTVSQLPWNIFAVDARRQNVALIDFGCLYQHRAGYGYKALAERPETAFGRGIAIAEVKSQTITTIVSTEDAWKAAVAHGIIGNETRDCARYLNHPVFSPDGRRFVFVLVVENGRARKLAMMVAETASGRILSVAGHRYATHDWWADNETVVIFVHHGDRRKGHYVAWNVESGVLQPLGAAWPKLDGHPSFSRTTGWWLTDTYPRLSGFQDLCLIKGLDSRKAVSVGRFFAPFGMKHDKCDLHPRFSPDGRFVAIDTAFDGRRQVGVIDVSAIVRKSK